MNITHEDLTQKQETKESQVILYPERFIQNTDKYNALMMMYRCAIREISTKLEVLDDEFSVKYKRNPFLLSRAASNSRKAFTGSFKKTAMILQKKTSGNS